MKLCIRERAYLALFAVSLVWGGCAPKREEVMILEVGPTKVGLHEYEDFYIRNSGGWEAAQQSSIEDRERFLDLLTNYKLKLQDAYARHLEDDPEIRQELREYRSSLASTYMLDKEITEPGIRRMDERRREEVRAQHILAACKPDASPEDTLKAYEKIMSVLRRAREGENFDSLALHYSDDPSARVNRGDVYYFSSGQMTPEFENGAFALQKGEISQTPVRTPFGYHVIKLLDRKPAPGSIKVRHIMARFAVAGTDTVDTVAAMNRVKGFQDSLKKGWDFGQLASKLSEDAGSAPDGGSLGWFERRRWVQPFDYAAFLLKPGETSQIVRTQYGYHLIHCDSAKAIPKYEEIRDELKKKYQQVRYNDEYQAYIKNLKKEYAFTLDEGLFHTFVGLLDSMKTSEDSGWADTVPADVRSRTLMTISGGAVLLDSFMAALEKRPEYHSTLLRQKELRARLDAFVESKLLDAKSQGLELRSPEFAKLMREYQDGVVLFKIEQMEVWNMVSVSDTALRSYFEQNQDKFMSPERVDYDEINIENDTLAVSVYDSLMNGADFGEMATRYNFEEDLKAGRGAHGYQPTDTDDLAAAAAEYAAGTITEPIELDQGGYVILRVNAKDPARGKSFEEAGAEVSNAFQEHESKRLEQAWLDRIRLMHPVKTFKEHLKEAFSAPKQTQ